MADKADQALKLAQKVEKDLVRIEKNLCDQINEGFKKITDMHNQQEKRFTELHKQQADEMKAIRAWAEKTFDTKGWF